MPREPKTRHLWMNDGRSLCDRRSQPRGDYYQLDEDAFEKAIREQEDAPACGSCLLLVARLRRQAAAILGRGDGNVYPKQPTKAWENLLGTRWDSKIDIPTFLERPDLNAAIDYEAISGPVDQESVDELLEEEREMFNRWREDYAEYRKRIAEAEAEASPDAFTP